ncbi:MAG: phosphoribosylamine--glycine ligase [Armatimonadetes bacterium]|nr:phosphoribosylamine--glycine ligase [Armatimonadota bacterium]
MRVLIVGSGGREHALAWKAAQSPRVEKIYCAPGNAGTAQLAECVDIKVTDTPGIVAFSKEQAIDLVIIGPDNPLFDGMADALRAAEVRTFGPGKAAAAIEGSKVFSKELMKKYGIPTADFRVFDDPARANAYIEDLSGGSQDLPIVVKADGLALGKGVIICDTKSQALDAVDDMMVKKVFGEAGERILVEERISGQEASLIVITDGTHVAPLTPAQDYKRVYDGDKGPNTGGMGCYSPVPVVPPAMYDQCIETLIKPAVAAMKAEGRTYTGTLYCGIMLTAEGPQVIEYNARFGDPETQVMLPLLETDLIELIEASLDGRLDSLDVKCYNGSAVCVVLASGGYPGKYETGKPITGLDEAAAVEGVTVFHAGTRMVDGRTLTAGGRVLGVTAVGRSFREARDRAYVGASRIKFENMHFRTDIGARVIE